jgi:hypothetical protein
MMKRQANYISKLASILVILLSAGSVWAQDDPEATIRLMGVAEVELPDVVMNEISLPESVEVNEAAVEKLEQALAHAGPGNYPEQSNAEDALQNAKDTVQDAIANREDRGRGDDMPALPDDLPSPPDDLPGPPNSPGDPAN